LARGKRIMTLKGQHIAIETGHKVVNPEDNIPLRADLSHRKSIAPHVGVVLQPLGSAPSVPVIRARPRTWVEIDIKPFIDWGSQEIPFALLRWMVDRCGTSLQPSAGG